MASLAIPFLFRPVLLNDAYYGDAPCVKHRR